MNLLDARTVLISYALITMLCLVVLWSFWRSNRGRIPGVGYWVADYALTAGAMVLISLRGQIPDFVSMVVSNVLILLGLMLLYQGVRVFHGRPTRQYHNWVFLLVYTGVHTYYAVVVPDLHARNINFSVGITFVSLQAAWFLLRARGDGVPTEEGRFAGFVMACFALVGIVRIALTAGIAGTNDIFAMGLVDTGALLAQEVLYIALSFSLLLMVNKRFTCELESDIVQRKAAEDALRRSERKFAAAFRGVPDALVVSMLSDGAILETNTAFEHIFGWRSDELHDASTVKLQLWADPTDRDDYITRLARERRVREYQTLMRRKSGEIFPAAISAELITIADQDCILGIVRDETERKRAEEEILRLNADLENRVRQRTEDLEERNRQLLEANSRLDEASAAKSRFLASMSHELRTPLNSVIGFSGMLAQGLVGELEPEQLHQVQMINSAGTHLLELVNQVLDLSAIESGEMRIEYTQVAIDDLVRSVVQSFVPMAQDKGLIVATRVNGTVGTVVTDRVRLRQVLLNLLGNAIKFTDEGSITLEASRSAEEIVLRVIDTGRGIEERERDAVFEEFYQAEQPGDAKATGTGLGLPVSRRLVEMLGGTLTLESEPGVGSTFTVTLPLVDLMPPDRSGDPDAATAEDGNPVS